MYHFLYKYPVPYYCARGSATIGTLTCMENPQNVNVPNLIAQANDYASQGRISSTINMFGDPVFIFHGTKDTAVKPGMLAAKLHKLDKIYSTSTIYSTKYQVSPKNKDTIVLPPRPPTTHNPQTMTHNHNNQKIKFTIFF